MKKLLIICAIVLLSSCDILKESSKRKTDIQATEQIETRTVRKGDTIKFQVPKITYKDTTIVKTNYVNRTQARVNYNSEGAVSSVECISSEINELRREIRTFTDNSKEKESSKEESFQSEIIIYIMLGLAVIVCGALFVFMWQARKQADGIKLIAEKLLN